MCGYALAWGSAIDINPASAIAPLRSKALTLPHLGFRSQLIYTEETSNGMFYALVLPPRQHA